MKYLPILFLALLVRMDSFAQDAGELKNQSWVRIMQNDTSINYFTAQRDYERFRTQWQETERTAEPSDKIEEPRSPGEPRLEDPVEFTMQSYEAWQRSMQPFVTDDGKVMSIEKRLELVQGRRK